MTTFIGSVVCAGLLAMGPAAVSAQTSTASAQANKSTDARIMQRLKADPSLKRYNIKVSVDGSIATLSGTVATEADRSKAADLAMVSGVTRVDNQILVDLNAATTGTAGTVERKTKEGAEKTKSGVDKAIDKTEQGATKAYEKSKQGGKKAAEKTKDGLDKAADKTGEGLSKAGQAVTDGWISTKINADMVNEDTLKGSDVKVETKDHVVTLSGTVMSEAGRARAVQIAKTTKGVTRVVDRLTIGPKRQ